MKGIVFALAGLLVTQDIRGQDAAGTAPGYSVVLTVRDRTIVAIEQVYATLAWVAERGAELGLDGDRLAIAGDSVGGNMTAAVAIMTKERGGPAIRYQALLYPVTDANFETGSYEEFAEGPWLTRKGMQWFWDAYLPDVSLRSEATASPLRASLEQLRGLPFAFDSSGLRVTDVVTDLAADPPGSGGVGLTPSGGGSLDSNTPGYVDFIDGQGVSLGGGVTAPSGAVFVRRWSIEPLAGSSDLIVVQVLARPLAAGSPPAGQRAAGEVRLVTMRARTLR